MQINTLCKGGLKTETVSVTGMNPFSLYQTIQTVILFHFQVRNSGRAKPRTFLSSGFSLFMIYYAVSIPDSSVLREEYDDYTFL